MKTPFLSIPRWRDMILLHGLLTYLIVVLFSTWLCIQIVKPEYQDLVQYGLYLVWLFFSPLAVQVYYWISSNRAVSTP